MTLGPLSRQAISKSSETRVLTGLQATSSSYRRSELSLKYQVKSKPPFFASDHDL